MQSEQEISRLVDPFRAFEVGSLELKGIPDELDADEIKSGLALNPTRKLFTKDKPAIYASNLGEDIARVRLYLARQGYPRNQVLAQVEKDDDKEVKVRLQVEPGSPVRLVGVEVTGVPPDRARDLRDEVKLEMGKPLVDREVQSSSAWVRSWLEHRGHARAQVQTELVSVGLDSVMVRLVATPGPIYFFDDLLIEGTRTDLTPLARKTAGIESGTRYSPSVIAQAHDQLRLLDLFRQIRIHPAFSDSVPPGEAQALDVAVARADTTAVVATAPREDMSGTPIPPDSLSTPVEPADSTVLGSATDERELDLRVELSNIDPRTLETGLGYWTDDFIIAHLSWRHRTLFGGGRGFRARGFYSLHRPEVTGAVWWPALIGARTRGEIQNNLERESEESYISLAEEVVFSLLYRPTLKISYQTGVRLTAADVEILTDDPEAFEQSGGYATVFFWDALLDASNDRLDPQTGGIVSIATAVSVPQILSDAPYIKGEATLTKYERLIGSSLVAAARLSGGWAKPIGEAEDLLANERFYSGGVNSMRGFKRRKLGPLDAGGAPLGGEVKLEGSFELRFPIWGKFVGAVFTDTGQLWEERDQLRLSELEVAVGGGIGFVTPIGPIRGDVGTRLTDIIPDQPKTVFHLAIGHPF